jgi:hypothetical protein
MPKECSSLYSQFKEIELIGCGRRAVKKEMEQIEKMRHHYSTGSTIASLTERIYDISILSSSLKRIS